MQARQLEVLGCTARYPRNARNLCKEMKMANYLKPKQRFNKYNKSAPRGGKK